MSLRPKFTYFLVHQETGQRYPVGREVIIGRSSGDMLFPQDTKLSNQHCRIIYEPGKLSLQDLGSSNGTYLNDKQLKPNKIYPLAAGCIISLGQQELKLEDTLLKQSLRKKYRRRRKSKKSSFDIGAFLTLLIVLAAGAFFFDQYLGFNYSKTEISSAPLESPRQIVEREMRQVFDEYKELGRNHKSGALSDKNLNQTIRQKLIPKLKAVLAKMSVLKSQNQWENQKIEANKNLIDAIINQLNAMANFNETNDQKFNADLEKFSEQVESLNEQVQRLEQLRKPANY